MTTPHTTGKITALAVALLTLVVGATHADDVTVDGFEYKNVRITALRDGKIYFIGPAGERSADLTKIKGMKLSAYPELEKADKAMAKEDYRTASSVLEGIYRRVSDDYLKVIIGRKLVYTLDKSGQFEKALQYYLPLLQIDTSNAVQSVAPRNLPEEADEKKALKGRVEGLVRTATTLEGKQYMQKILEALKGDGELSADSLPAVDGSLDAAAASRDYIAEFIEKKQYDKALELIDKQLPDRGVSLSKLLYQRGQVLEAQGKDMEALESFMRVVVHYDPRQTDYYVPALVEAGKVFKKLGKMDHARNVWTEARKEIGDDPDKRDAAAEVQKLLGSL